MCCPIQYPDCRHKYPSQCSSALRSVANTWAEPQTITKKSKVEKYKPDETASAVMVWMLKSEAYGNSQRLPQSEKSDRSLQVFFGCLTWWMFSDRRYYLNYDNAQCQKWYCIDFVECQLGIKDSNWVRQTFALDLDKPNEREIVW